jgi:hypothetical protein
MEGRQEFERFSQKLRNFRVLLGKVSAARGFSWILEPSSFVFFCLEEGCA